MVRRCSRHVWAVRVTRARPAASRSAQSQVSASKLVTCGRAPTHHAVLTLRASGMS